MIGIVLGIFTILLGAKAFTPSGIPLTKTRHLTGGVAKGVGIACIVLGLLFIADGLFGVVRMVAR